MTVEIKAYAKVNLHLEVLNKRNDGMHNIRSIMAAIDIFDLLKLKELSLSNNNSSVDIELECKEGIFSEFFNTIPLEDNIISLAISEYFSYSQRNGRVILSIEKNIPSGAGLGGGSADAAAVLLLLNNELRLLNQDELFLIAERIGADVPYCLYANMHKKSALCEGIGEILTPFINRFQDHSLIIVNDGIHINTGEAYGALNRTVNYENNQHNYDILFNNESANNMQKDILYLNDFETVIFPIHKSLQNIKEQFYNRGAEFSLMTGSGSSIIGLYNNQYEARKVFESINNDYEQVYITSFI